MEKRYFYLSFLIHGGPVVRPVTILWWYMDETGKPVTRALFLGAVRFHHGYLLEDNEAFVLMGFSEFATESDFIEFMYISGLEDKCEALKQKVSNTLIGTQLLAPFLLP